MKRYLLFYNQTARGNGGMKDCIGKFDTLGECYKAIYNKVTNSYLKYKGQLWDTVEECFDSKVKRLQLWYQIYDTQKEQVIQTEGKGWEMIKEVQNV